MSVVDHYLDELESSLLGRKREIADIVEEVAGGITDLVAGLRATGVQADDADLEALAWLGPVELIVPPLQRVLAAQATRRTAVLTAAALLIQPLVWSYLFRFVTIGYAAPTATHRAMDGFVEWIGATTLIFMLLAFLATGRGTRLDIELVIARGAGMGGLVAVGAVALVGVAVGVSGPVTAGVNPVTVLLWTSAFLFLPLSVAGRAAHHALKVGRVRIRGTEGPVAARVR